MTKLSSQAEILHSPGSLHIVISAYHLSIHIMKSTVTVISPYDLSNPHFCRVTLITQDNKELKGQFVSFKVIKDKEFEFLYPAEKYCFLTEDKREEFWLAHHSNNGEFKNFPAYILQFGLDDIRSIYIQPLLSV